MKSYAMVVSTLCLGIVTLFSVVSCGTPSAHAGAANPDARTEEPFVIIAEPSNEAAAQGQTNPIATQTAYYTFDEGDGAQLSDAVAFNNGHVSGKFWRAGGVRNNALVLEEAQVEIANHQQLQVGTSPYSMSVWVNLQKDSSVWIDKRDFQNEPKVVEGEFGGTFDNYVPVAGYSLWVSEHETDGTFVNFFINQMGIEFKLDTQFAPQQSLSDGKWHQIVVTVDPGKSGGLVMYVDGVAMAWADANGLTHPYDSTSPMFMYGRGKVGIDEFNMLSEALSAEQVASRFSAQQ